MFNAERTFETLKSPLGRRRRSGRHGPARPVLDRAQPQPGLPVTFLGRLYAAAGRPTGVNNIALPGTAMPHVLADLQGVQTLVVAERGH